MESSHAATENGRDCYPVVIIGAGASGIAMGCKLKEKLGFEDFILFDRQSGVGGTWWSNKYPGVECDVPVPLYTFSFAPRYSFNKIYPTGQEYLEYLDDVITKYHIQSKIKLNTEVTDLQYLAESGEWQVIISHLPAGQGDLSVKERQEQHSVPLETQTIKASIVISCVGVLVEPNGWPRDIPGLEGFLGNIIHSSKLRESTDLSDQNVVVVGSGCSAAQIVPALLKTNVKSVTQIMRTPPWVEARVKEPGGREAYAKYAPSVFRYLPFLGPLIRAVLYWYVEFEWATIFQGKHTFLRSRAERTALSYMRSKVPSKYHSMMTPRYSYGCKRRVFDNMWLESMNDDRFNLVMQPLKALGLRSILLEQATPEPMKEVDMPSEVTEIEADTIILGNGFEATRFLHPLSVRGREGASLHEVWENRGGAQAYMGTAMDGFPNFFMIVGPNTFVGHTSVILGIESTIGYILKLIGPILRGQVKSVEPKMEATVEWTNGIQESMKRTVFAGCSSWYRSESGWNPVLYPRSQIDFSRRCRSPRYQDWTILKKEDNL